MKKFFSLVLALVMALSLTTVAWGAEVPVAETAALNAALPSASSGDIIKLAANTTYDLTATIPEGVTLEGAGESTVLNLGAAQYKISKNNVTIKNVTIKDEVNSINAGLWVEGVNVTLESVNYASVNEVAITLRNKTTTANTFTLKKSTLSSTARGIGWCYFTGTILVEDSVIDSGNSIHIDEGGNTAKIVIKESTLYGNVAAGKTGSFEFENVTFKASKSAGSAYAGVSSYSAAAPRTFKDCTFTSATDIGMKDVTAAITLVGCNLNGTPITAENITTLMPGNYAAANVTVDGDMAGAVAEVGGTQYKSLAEAVAAAAGGTVKLLDDVTLTGSINVTDALTIDGNNKTITMTYTGAPGTGNAFFNALIGNEGIDDSLTVKNLKMVMTGATKQGYAVVAKKADSAFAISFTDCHFENMYCAVMLNGCGGTVAPTVTITDSSFKDVNYGLSFAEEAYAGDVSFEGNTMTGEISIQETFPAGSGYLTTPTVEISSGSFTSDVTDYLADDVFQTANGGVVAVPNSSRIPTGGPTLVEGSIENIYDPTYASWTAKISAKRAEDVKDSEFATYTIEMIAKVDGAPIWWASGVEEKGEDVDFHCNGEKEFVKVTAAGAWFTLVDGKDIIYLAPAENYNDDAFFGGWDELAEKVTLPVLPDAEADMECATYYAWDKASATFYKFEDTLYREFNSDTDNAKDMVIFNVDGVAVVAIKAKMGDATRIDGDVNTTYDKLGKTFAKGDYVYTAHNYVVERQNDSYKNNAVTKVYCDLCKNEFTFVESSNVSDAVKAFKAGNYFGLETKNGKTVYLSISETSGATGSSRPSTGSSSGSTSTGKVESAPTFDAGISLYVGMSIAAAAGSVVVLKKRED